MSREIEVRWRCDWCNAVVTMGEDRSVQPEGWARVVIGDRPTANLNEPEYIALDWQVCDECRAAVVVTAGLRGACGEATP